MGDHEDALMTLFKRHIHTDGLKTTAHDFGQQFCIHTTGKCGEFVLVFSIGIKYYKPILY